MTSRVIIRTTPTHYTRDGVIINSFETPVFFKRQDGQNTIKGARRTPNRYDMSVIDRSLSILETMDIDVYTSEVLVRESQPFQAFENVDNLQPDISRICDIAASKLRERIADYDVNFAQAFAERKQTERLFSDTAKRIANAFFGLRRGNFASVQRALGRSVRAPRSFKPGVPNHLDRAAAAWLELTYGWKPLLQDCYGSAVSLAKSHDDNRLQPITVRARHSETAKSTKSDVMGLQSDVTSISYEAGCSYTVRYIRDSKVSASDLGLTNPALLAWELLPYSFVFDWILPVGNYLEGLTATQGKTFLDGCMTTKQSTVFKRSLSGRSRIGGVEHIVLYPANATSTMVDIHRYPLAGFPSNPLPRFKNPVSFSHFASALALLRVAFRR